MLQIFFIIGVFCTFLCDSSYGQTPLQKYLAKNTDSSYVNYKLLSTTKNTSCTIHTLNVTSLIWLSASLTSASKWWHVMRVIVPDILNKSQPIFFYIDYGNNNPVSTPSGMLDLLVLTSVTTSSVVVSMAQVPNQPIIFTRDPSKTARYEDDAISWTINEWVKNSKFYTGVSDELPLLLPMAKSVKRGMDMALKFLSSKRVTTSGKFIVSGISKRGWATLLIAAGDPRVIAAIPIVFDYVNLDQSLHEQYRKMGGAYSFAIADYWSQNFTLNVDTLEFYNSRKIFDFMNYMESVQGKGIFFILAANDEFMMPWHTRLFWDQLSIQISNKAYIRRIPNADHYFSTTPTEFRNTLLSALNLMLFPNKNFWPLIQWSFANNETYGVIKLTVANLALFQSIAVNGYHANTLTTLRKDFRAHYLTQFGPAVQVVPWQIESIDSGTAINPTQTYTYEYAIERDETFTSFTGFFMEVALTTSLLSSSSQTVTFTTETNIIPEWDPAGDCRGFQCRGGLI